MNFILRLFLTFSSLSFFIIVYLVQNKIIYFEDLFNECPCLIYVGYVLIPFILTVISLGLGKLLSKSSIKKIESIEPSNNDFLANYLAFFFVALSIKDSVTFWVVFGMTILFTFFSRVSYFNPVFLIFGFNFYYVQTNEKVKVMLITRKKIKNPKLFESVDVRRINDYTFIEV